MPDSVEDSSSPGGLCAAGHELSPTWYFSPYADITYLPDCRGYFDSVRYSMLLSTRPALIISLGAGYAIQRLGCDGGVGSSRGSQRVAFVGGLFRDALTTSWIRAEENRQKSSVSLLTELRRRSEVANVNAGHLLALPEVFCRL